MQRTIRGRDDHELVRQERHDRVGLDEVPHDEAVHLHGVGADEECRRRALFDLPREHVGGREVQRGGLAGFAFPQAHGGGQAFREAHGRGDMERGPRLVAARDQRRGDQGTTDTAARAQETTGGLCHSGCGLTAN